MGFSRQEYWSGVPWPFPRYAYSKIIDIGSSILGFPGGSVVKNPPVNAGDLGLIPGQEDLLGEGNGNPL